MAGVRCGRVGRPPDGVKLGGSEATELSTPVGTGLRWNADGVSYALAGSVPASELEQAARTLR